MSKKEIIKECAITLFHQYGYKSVTADMIVNNANVSKGLLFFHFKNMEGLISQIILDWLIPKWESVNALDLQGLSLTECLEKIFKLTKTGLENQKSQYKLYLSIMLNEPEFVSKLDLQNIKAYKDMLECLLFIFKTREVENPESELIFLNNTLLGIEMSYCMHTKDISDHFFDTTKKMFLERY